jgi:hypothetical protein
MATGYTSIVVDKPETTFREFALICARAFGALFHLRDEPLDTPWAVPATPDDYHLRSMEDLAAKRKQCEEFTDDEVLRQIELVFWHRQKSNAESRARVIAEKRALQAMLKKVKKWTPPTGEHDGLKKFMIEQLEVSMPTTLRYYPKVTKKFKHELSAKAWRKHELARIDSDMEYHRKSWEETIERTAERSAWASALIDALK